MKRFRKIFGTAISTVLLLIFSVTVVPLDLLHNHSQQPVCSTNSPEGSTCKHKLHISKKSALCLLCGIHHDKTFIAPATAGVAYLPVHHTDHTEHVTRLSLSAEPVYMLRGPPSQQVSLS